MVSPADIKHAILTDTSLDYLVDGKFTAMPVDTSSISNAGQIIDLAVEHGLKQIWVLPGTAVSTRVNDDSFVTSVLDSYNLFPTELAPFIHGWKRDDKRIAVDIALPEYNDKLPFAHLTTSKEFFATLLYLHSLLNMPVIYSAGRTGIELIKQTNTYKRSTYLDVAGCDLTLFYEHATTDLQWARALTSEETAIGYLHGIDSNAAYLAACSALHIGSGAYTHVTHPHFDKKYPGLWHITLAGSSIFDGIKLPHPTNGAGDTWLDTAMVQCCIECGYLVNVLEGYLWTEYHTLLTPWYKVLSNARMLLMEANPPYNNVVACTAALSTIKRIYAQCTGLLGHKPGETYKPHWYDRPDIRNAIVGESKRRMFAAMRQVVDQGVRIVEVYVDDLFYVSDNPDATTDLPFTLSTQLGKFKAKSSYPLSDVAHLLTDKPYTLTQGLALLHGGVNNG